MGKACFICLIIVVAVLLEDVGPTRRTKEEEKEDRELAEKVNATLAEEEKERQEEEAKEKKRQDKEKKQDETGQGTGSGTGSTGKERGQDEACPTLNHTCPERELCPTCPEVKNCPEKELCEPCPEIRKCPPCGQCPEVMPPKECSPCRRCEPCPEIDCHPCRECLPLRECEPCSFNYTVSQNPGSGCSDPADMSVPVALAVGASAGVLLTGVAAAIGLILRYVDTIASGFLFMAIIVIIWYLCSHYPETARELGGHAVNLLREAAVALGHRMMAAIQRQQEQVGFPVLVLFFLLSDLSSMFHLKIVCTKIFYVEKLNSSKF
jgi:hypothetical protein